MATELSEERESDENQMTITSSSLRCNISNLRAAPQVCLPLPEDGKKRHGKKEEEEEEGTDREGERE